MRTADSVRTAFACAGLLAGLAGVDGCSRPKAREAARTEPLIFSIPARPRRVFEPTAEVLRGSEWETGVKLQPVYIPTPTYSALAPPTYVQEQVTVSILVDESGKVTEAKVAARSGNPAMDSAAVEAARKARFTPPMQGGRPTSVHKGVRYTFPATSSQQ